MSPVEAVAHALDYLDGAREGGSSESLQNAELLLERLARSGFVLRERKKHERRMHGLTTLDVKGLGSHQIQATRVALGLTIAELARRAGIASETLAGIESGRKKPQPRSVQAVLDALGRMDAGLEKSANERR